MPIYEYRCRSCGREFEVIVRSGGRGPRKCQHCSGRLEKLVSRAAFQLKGGGWFAEGYTSSGGKKSDTKTETKSDSSGGRSSKSGESKVRSKRAAS